MRRTTVLVLAGTAVVAAGASAVAEAGGASHGPIVTVRIEGAKKTLQRSIPIKTGTGWITKYGAPKGKCPARSAQGALDVVTHGRWKGTWSTQFNEYFVTSILGEKPAGHDFWEIFVNNTAASKGGCDLKLQRGEQLLFADTSGKDQPSALTAPRSATVGTAFAVRLVGYSSKGKARPLSGVSITGNGIRGAKTNSHGVARVSARRKGKPVLRAAPKGYIRSEAVVSVSG